MTDPLREAARAYREALAAEATAKAEVEAARQKRAAASEGVATARAPLADAIVQAAREGVRQRDILIRIENAYTRERVRQICRSAGVQVSE
ncbi:hypothetical protein ACQEVC_45370 [Plantactinospora sp. CA-294935]|uniref:hypothetical protein n=1 Tax=Plantactinospora sp. CA-294935 TaxID=3240012 RepID=UPI003D8D50BF